MGALQSLARLLPSSLGRLSGLRPVSSFRIPAGAPESRRRTSVFHPVMWSTSSQIECPPATGLALASAAVTPSRIVLQRRTVPRIAVVLARELIKDSIDFGLWHIALQ